MGHHMSHGQRTQDLPLEASLSRSESDYFLRVVLPGKVPVEIFLKEAGELLIGRDPALAKYDDALHIDHPTVSHRHALIQWNEHSVTIRNFSAKNGTLVNGIRIEGFSHLFPNDDIRLGDVEILYRGTRSSASSGQLYSDHSDDPTLIAQLFRDVTGALIADRRTCQIYRELYRIAPSPVSVLIVGETGVGKELAAQALHRWSSRGKGPFRCINCSAIPEDLIESEFFGHVKGAFTGATTDKVGLFQSAHQGTLFLDEIATLSSAGQAKLLRALDGAAITPVGSTQQITVDVRIASATNENLQDKVRRGEFREDLYYRLGHFPIAIPPLRARQHDIMPLAQHFLCTERINQQKPLLTLAPEAAAYLQSYSWPGNIRELQAVMKRLATLAEVMVITGPMIARELRRLRDEHSAATKLADTQVVTSKTTDDEQSLSLYEACLRCEFNTIQKALAQTSNNVSQAAKLLGINRPDVYRRLERLRRQLGIE